MLHKAYILIIGIIFSSCITQIEESFDDYERQLVVEGGINNLAGPYEIQLNYTGDVLGQIYRNRIPITGATVTLEEKDGIAVLLNEPIPGKYLTDSASIRGVVGNSYRILINLPDGATYTSSWETIPAAPVVSDATVEYQVLQVQDELNAQRTFTLQQHVASISLTNVSDLAYYKIEALGTEQQLVQPNPPLFPPDGCESFFYGATDEGRTTNCWQFLGELSNGIRLLSNEFFESAEIQIDALTVPFDNRGTFLATINILGLNGREYEFWQTINKQNAQQADLFNPPLEAINGNIFSNENDNETVVGYFSAHSLVQQSVCINRLTESAVRPIPAVLAPCFTNCLTLYPNSTWEPPDSFQVCN